MLPGLKSRAYKHRNLNDPRDKLCNGLIDGHPCDIEETLIHFFCECPGTQAIWIELKRRILIFTEYVDFVSPVTDIQCLFVDLRGSKRQIRTATWVMATFLSRIYDCKMAGKPVLSFDELWVLANEDILIAKNCKGGKWLDETFFQSFDTWEDSFELDI